MSSAASEFLHPTRLIKIGCIIGTLNGLSNCYIILEKYQRCKIYREQFLQDSKITDLELSKLESNGQLFLRTKIYTYLVSGSFGCVMGGVIFPIIIYGAPIYLTYKVINHIYKN